MRIWLRSLAPTFKKGVELGAIACTCGPKVAKQKQAKPWSSLANLAELVGSQFSERLCLKNTKWRVTEEDLTPDHHIREVGS